MSLLDKLKREQLNQRLYGFLFHKDQAKNSEFAHFCEHDGISISFTRAQTTWHAMAPCALKPWWLFLNPLKKNRQHIAQTDIKNSKQDNTQIKKIKTAATAETATAEIIEVTENA